MKKRSNRTAGFLALALFLGAGALFAGFPLWLDTPERANLKDPKNPKAVVGTATSTPTATNTPVVCALWDDFEESGASWTPYYTSWCGPTSTDCATNYVDALDVDGLFTDKVHSGAQSYGVTITADSANDCLWGLPYWGFTVNTVTGAGDVDATCASQFCMWVVSDKALHFDVMLREGSNPPADQEQWIAAVTVTASAGFKAYSIPLSSFSYGGVNGCLTCTAGNTVLDKNDISFIWFYERKNIPGVAHVRFDDIGFCNP
ncbi:MAG: hypothetical protein V4498_09285 [candidate division FCPU426 bacterium]